MGGGREKGEGMDGKTGEKREGGGGRGRGESERKNI